MESIEPITLKELSNYKNLKKLRPTIREYGTRVVYKGNTLPQLLYIYSYKLKDLMNISAVYFLINNKNVVYVGQTNNLFRRISEHKDKLFDDIYWFPTNKTELKTVEEYFIIAMNPEYNKTHYKRLMLNIKMLWLDEKRKNLK